MNLVDIQVALLTDELDEAIRGMLDFDSKHNNGKLQNQIIHQSGRYHGNEKSNNIGTISSENYNRTRNQLRYALQELMKKFPGYGPEIQRQANDKMIASSDSSTPNSVSDSNTPTDSAPQVFKILMLTSNPSDTGKLQLDTEHSLVSRQIQNSGHPSDFPIISKQAVTLSRFTESLHDERPVIVHFSGHGEKNIHAIKRTVTRGVGLDEDSSHEENTGIILTSEDGRESHFVNTSTIRRVFRSMVKRHKIPIQAVIFNSCYSEAQAQALADLIPNVIGTTSAVSDPAAIAFANGFYSFLIRTRNIEDAWDNGVNLATGYNEPEERFIYFKNGEKVEL